MANVNLVIVIGNLTRDPQVKFLANEKAVANFGLAINRKYKTADGEQKEEVTFLDVEAWGRTAELAGQYLVKGRPVFIEGHLKLETWDDKDGQKRSKLKVVADSLQFLGEKGPANDQAKPTATDPPKVKPTGPSAPSTDEEPPF